MAKLNILLPFLLTTLAVAGAPQTQNHLRSRSETSDRRSLQNAGTFPFVEENGMVVIEAESADPIVEPWKVETIYRGYTGSGHIRFDGNSIYGGDVSATMSYFIEINNPGDYILTMRARKNNTQVDLSNDCYFKLVGHPGILGNHVKTYLAGRPGVFQWNVEMEWGHDNKFIPTYNLNAKGTYELQLAGRSKHFVIDRIVLYNTDFIDFRAERRSVWNTPESPRKDGPGVPPSVFQGLVLTTAGPGTYSEIQEIKNGGTVSLGAVGTSISGLLRTYGEVGSVRFDFDGNTRIEGSAPFTLGGGSDDTMDPVPYLSYAGPKTIVTSIFDANGDVMTSETVTFTMIEATISPTPAPQTSSPTRTSPTLSPTLPPPTTAPTSSAPVAIPVGVLKPLLLTTAGKSVDLVIQSVNDGAVLYQLDVGTRLSMLAETEVAVSSIKFFYGGKVWTEGLAPYAMAGNVGTRNLVVQYLSSTGEKRVIVKAYDATGNEIGVRDVTFMILAGHAPSNDVTAAPTAPPVTDSPTSPPTSSPATVSPTAPPTLSPIAVSPATIPPTAGLATTPPTATPTAPPSDAPTESPTVLAATTSPTASPTQIATGGGPTPVPTASPTSTPTASPTSAPTATPTSTPTATPTKEPEATPSSIIQSLDLTTASDGPSIILVENIASGADIFLASTGSNLSIIAHINPSVPVSRVSFEYDGGVWWEGLAPYAMAGNAGSQNYPVDYLSTPGEKFVTIRAHDSSMSVLESVLYTFTVVEPTR